MSTDPGLPPQLTEGTWPFELLAPIGRGGSATVWRAQWLGARGPVALKVGHSAREAPRFALEAERIAAVDSPYLIPLLDVGLVPELAARRTGLPARAPYLVFDWFDGRALDPAHLPNDQPRERLALCVARDVARAIADLHRSGTAHGDIKPANVLWSSIGPGSGSARLIDLGLAIDSGASRPQGGTPRYLSPETFDPKQPLSARSRDLWALGLTLAEIADPSVQALPAGPALIDSLQAPGELHDLIAPLLSRTATARPSAAWVAARAERLLGETSDTTPCSREAWPAQVRASYLALRRRELARIARGARAVIGVEGLPGDWLRRAASIFARIAGLRGLGHERETCELAELSRFERESWLLALIGPSAPHLSVLGDTSDDRLARLLLELARDRDPKTLTRRDLDLSQGVAAEISNDPIRIAFELSKGYPCEAVFEAAEAESMRSGSPALRWVLGSARRRQGRYSEALVIFDRIGDAEATAEAAEICRRMTDPAEARRRIEKARALGPNAATLARLAATEARVTQSEGALERAIHHLEGALETSAVLETRAFLQVQKGEVQSALELARRALDLASDSEEAGRAETVLGAAHHALGEPRLALSAFGRAAAHAARVGAVVEEATYFTNVAAAAVDLGNLVEAIPAAQRAAILFDHLGRPADAARALLSLLAAHAVLGALTEAETWAEQTLRLARRNHDDRCSGFVHLALADLLLDIAGQRQADGREHAERALTLLQNGSASDLLRCRSRLLRSGAEVALDETDRMAKDVTLETCARLDWWRARALDLLHRSTGFLTTTEATRILGEVMPLIGSSASVGSRGPCFAQTAELARRVGLGDFTRRLVQAGQRVARELREGAPPEWRDRVSALAWVRAVDTEAPHAFDAAQLRDIEHLIRSLSARDRLRPLLDQILDALVLWTGVERGLLLLAAPGGRLVVRAARNLARTDLRDAQLALSHSLAERALASGEPVVAVDAMGEIEELSHSVHHLGLRSVLAVPLIARGQALGVVYLDDRTRRGAFGPSELGWVKLVGSFAAIAVADARDQLLLRRAARRARRAQGELESALSRSRGQIEVLERELTRSDLRGARFRYQTIVGESEAIRTLLRLIDRVAVSEIPVLVEGESGTGKELVARAIHDHGPRARGPFVSENCSAIPEGLLESTLFGHTKGSFTGAVRTRAGLFEIADGGTLFLDEVGEMSLGMQAKLLRVLESGELRPLGSERVQQVDVRVVAATHRNLEQLTETGQFRSDLLFRLKVISLKVPPLRQRRQDIPLLVAHFCKKHAPERPISLSPEASYALERYDWPGNVRELENETRRFLVLADDRIALEHLSPGIAHAAPRIPTGRELDLRFRVDALETELVRQALDQTAGNQTRAAELLNVSRFGLQKMIKRLQLDELGGGQRGRRGQGP